VGSAGPFRGAKGNLYEGGTREPFIVWAPGLIPTEKKGTTNEVTVMAGMDLPPSLLKIAGANKDKGIRYDGIDMSKALLGKAEPIRKKPVMWQRTPENQKQPGRDDLPDVSVREGRYKLLVNTDGSRPELYDLATDEGETTNLASENPKMTTRLKKKALKWVASMPAMRVTPE